jgi:phage tail protein X
MPTLQTLIVPNDRTPVDLLIFLELKTWVAGLVEDTLTRNPGLADLGPFPPRGTAVVVAIPSPAVTPPAPVVQLY